MQYWHESTVKSFCYQFSVFWAEFQRLSQDLNHSDATLIDDEADELAPHLHQMDTDKAF